MKNILSFVLALILLASCQKKSSPQPTQSTSTNNGNGTTSTNDTTDKVKVFYCLQMNPLTVGYGTTGRDYVQDTTNVRIYHNATQLHTHFVNMSTEPDKLGLNVLENGLISSFSHTVTPLWCSLGDSIVITFDSLEVDVTTAAQSERFERMMVTITKNGVAAFNFDTYQYSNWGVILNPYYQATGNSNKFLGTTILNGITQNWFIGGRFRLVYKVQ